MESIKLKKLPIACRYVPYDQWFVTHIEPTWKIKHLKQQILFKCHSLQVDPRDVPASEGGPSSMVIRSPSPITFAQPRSSTSVAGEGEPEPGTNGRDSPIRFAAVNTRNPLALEGMGSGDELETDDSSSVAGADNLRVGEAEKHGDHDDGYEEDNEWEEADGPGPGGRVTVPGNDVGVTPTIIASPTASRTKGFNALRIGTSTSGGQGQTSKTVALQVPSIHPRRTSPPRIQTHPFTLVRFSTGQILEDDYVVSWYEIAPHELFELHFSVPPIDFNTTINVVSQIILTPDDEGTSSGRKKNKHRPTPSQNNVLGLSVFDPTAMGFPPLPPASAGDALRGHSGWDAPSVMNQRTLTALPRSNPTAYIQPYWEGWVRALRVVVRPDAIDTDPVRYTYGQFGSSLAGTFGGVVPPKPAHVEERKPKTNLEWRERWVVIKDGTIYLCKDRQDLEPTHRLPLSYLITLKGAEHLVQSISKGSRGRDGHGRPSAPGRDAANEKDDKTLRPPPTAMTTSSSSATRSSPSGPHPIDTNQPKRARGTSDAGLLSPTSRNKGKGRETGDGKERDGGKDARRRSISPRAREPSNVASSSRGKEKDPGTSTIRPAVKADKPQGSAAPSGSRPQNVTIDPKSRTEDGRQVVQRPLTEAEIEKRRLEKEKRQKEREEERKRRQKEQEAMDSLMRWDDIGWSSKNKEKIKEKERQRAKEKKEKKEREEEKRREKEQVRSKGDIERAREKEEKEKEKERQREREREKEKEKERERERERQRERQREKEKEKEREKQRLLAKRHDKTYIPSTTEEADMIGMKIVCAKFRAVRKSQTKPKPDSDLKYTSTGPTLAGEPPLPPQPADLELVKKDLPLDEAFLSQRKASLPHLGLNFLSTPSGPSSSHPTKEGGAVKFGIPGLFGKDKDKKDKKDKKREDEEQHDDEEHHHASTGLGWKLGRKKKGGGDVGSDFEVVSMPAVLERTGAAAEYAAAMHTNLGAVAKAVIQDKPDVPKPSEDPVADVAPPPQVRVKPQRPAVVTTSLDPLVVVASEAENQNQNQNADGESQRGHELNSPTSDSMSLSSPVFAHSTDGEDSMDNDSILDGPRKTWGERGDRKGYRYGGYHSSGPMKAKEKEREETGNDSMAKPVQATAATSTQQTQASQPVQSGSAVNLQPTPSRPAPPPPQTREQPPQAPSSTRTLAPSTSGRKKEEEKGEWIVLDMGSEHAFLSILRIFHRHFPPPISSSFTPYLEAFTAAAGSPVISKDPVEKSAPSAPGPLDRSTNASLRTVETSAASINDNSTNTIPSLSLAVPYPEWRLEILSKARTHGMRDAFRPLDLASRGCAPESEDNEASNLRKQSDAKVSSKAYAHLRRMSAQSRSVFSPASSRHNSKLGAQKRAKKRKLRTKASHTSEGDGDKVTLDDGSISISVSQDDTGSLAYEDGDVDEADEYDEDDEDEGDDDDQSFAPSQMEDPSASLSKRMDRLDDGLFDASDADSRLGVHDDNVFSLASFDDSDEESELEWMAWVSDIPRQVALKSDRQPPDQAKTRSNVVLRKPQSSVTLFSNPFGGSSSPYLPTDLHQDSWIPKIHAEEMRLVAENRRRLEPSAVGMSRSSSDAYGQSISAPSTYHYGYPYYSDTESSPREKPLDMRVQQAHYASDTPSYGSQPIDIVRDAGDVYGSHNVERRQSSSSIESLSITRYHDRINASNITRNQSPDSPIYGSPPARNHMQDYDEIPPVPPVPDEYLSQSPRSPTFTGASPSKSSTTTTPRHVRKHSRSLSGAIGSPHGSHPPLSPSSKQASGLYHSASFHTPTRNEGSGLSSSRPDMPILSPEQISRIERETDEKMSGATSSVYASSSRGGLSVYDSYSASTGSRTANTSSVSVNNPYGHVSSSAYSQMFDGPPVRVKVEQATTTTSSALHASTSYPSMTSAARSSHASTPSNPTSTAANVLQSAGRGIVSLIHGNLMPRRSSSAGLLGKPNPAQPATPQEGPSVTFANTPASSLGRSPSYRIKAQGMADKDKGPNVLRKRLSDLNRERPSIPVMSSSPPNPNLMSPRQRPKLSLPGIHNSPPPRDVAEPTSPRLQQARSPTSTTMGINSPMESSAGPWSTVDSSEQIHQSVVGAVQVPGSSNQSSNAMASARALLRRVRSGSSLHTPMGMHMEEPGSPETPYGVNNLSRSP